MVNMPCVVCTDINRSIYDEIHIIFDLMNANDIQHIMLTAYFYEIKSAII